MEVREFVKGGRVCLPLAVLSRTPGHPALGLLRVHAVGRRGSRAKVSLRGLTQKCRKGPWGAQRKKELSAP